MKQMLQIAAHELVETALAHPHADCKELCDAGIRALVVCECCSTADLRKFPGIVSRELRSRGVHTASLATPLGESGEQKTSIAQALQEALKASVELSEHAHPSLIGGAMLRIGDDVLDRSLRGALHSLESYLTRY